MSADLSAYMELKRQKAVEQGKVRWFEAVLTDEEAHLRSIPKGERMSCNLCRRMRDTARHYTAQCLLGHHPTDVLRQTCDEWRYFV